MLRLRRGFSVEKRAEYGDLAKETTKHAPTNLDPERPRWRERPPIILRRIAVYDHLRDFPRGAVRNR